MTPQDDRSILITALEGAVRAYEQADPRPSLLSGPGQPIIDAISDAITRCSSFEKVAGHVLYSGGSGPVVDAHLFAQHLFYKAEVNSGEEIPQAVDWLLRLLATRETVGVFKAATIDRELGLADGSRVMPFANLPDSFMKTRILERSSRCYDNSAWLAHNYFDAPMLAFVQEVPDFPYIRTDGASFQRVSELQYAARDLWLFIEATTVGQPLAIGCWFEYADQGLDVNGWENQLAWLLPEIPPRVAANLPVSADMIQDQLGKYAALPADLRSRLLRSMERFSLSQCRHKLIDRVLDLELAFEIAVSGPGRDASPMGWKVSVRSAQLIGGPLDQRQQNRDLINELFKLRSKATHGSDLSGRDETELRDTVRRCLSAYGQLIASLLALGQAPDWSSLELQPRAI